MTNAAQRLEPTLRHGPKVMILGAGVYQVPLLRQARRLGLKTIVVSRPGPYPGWTLADQAYRVDTTDRRAVLRIARAERVSAVATCGTDVAMRSAGYVCDRLGLPGVSERCARLCTDKLAMKAVLQAAGVRTAPFRPVGSLAAAARACRALGYPAILKCVDQSGSRGVCRVARPAQLAAAYRYVHAATARKEIVVERFVPGHEIGLTGLALGGRLVLWLHDKLNYFNGASNVTLGHIVPLELGAAAQRRVRTQAARAVRALEIRDTFFNMDIMLAADGVYILEAGARMGATCIPELIGAAYGFDCYEQILRCALGRAVRVRRRRRRACAVQLLTAPRSGVLQRLALRRPVPGVVVQFDYQPGEQVRRFHVGPDRIGHLVAPAATRAAARRRLRQARAAVTMVLARRGGRPAARAGGQAACR